MCHLPPGTSKWNKIEHRLFSHISMNWRGRPLTSHEVIVETIAATTTSTGLTRSRRTRPSDPYPTGVKIPDTQMKALEAEGVLARHNFHGEWNYTLCATRRDEIQRGRKDPAAGQSQLPGEAEGRPIRGNAGEAGSSPDNVRDGSALSDGPGSASSEEKVYARNHCLMPRNSSTRLKSDGYGPGVQRVTIGGEVRMVNSEAGQCVRWGGHGEGLRRNRGDAAGVQVGTSLLDRFGRERGNHPRSPNRRAASSPRAGSLPAEGDRVGRRPRSSPSGGELRTWQRRPASQ